MTTITTRPYKEEADLETIAYLINICDTIDKDEGVSVTELKTDINTPSVDRVRDLKLWEDADGKLIGFGFLWLTEPSETIDGFMSFYVHPSARGGDLETKIIQWSQERMHEVSQERSFPVRLLLGVRDYQNEHVAIVESNGFTRDRYFFTMERSLAEPIPQPQFPGGFTLRQMNGEQDAPAWVELHNQSFIDHWNYHPLTVENLKYWLNEPTYRPELDLIATAADGTFAAFCHCYVDPDYNARTGLNEGWVRILGTQRGFRRMGLGRAILLCGLHCLKAADMETARLGVDADNPNGALRLYESIGFRKKNTRIMYVKSI
ncbi:MAG: GNAT family N-acetyltransferase [Iphinoe sp. HA4291-MV1]|jgi:mycothiol synthase|nr:GNAT family N-acetyltransferase [Iphinoe sp. HA4291-MV1]